MDKEIKDYSEAVAHYIKVSQQETRLKIQVQQARHRLQQAKQLMRSKEEEMLEPSIVP